MLNFGILLFGHSSDIDSNAGEWIDRSSMVVEAPMVFQDLLVQFHSCCGHSLTCISNWVLGDIDSVILFSSVVQTLRFVILAWNNFL